MLKKKKEKIDLNQMNEAMPPSSNRGMANPYQNQNPSYQYQQNNPNYPQSNPYQGNNAPANGYAQPNRYQGQPNNFQAAPTGRHQAEEKKTSKKKATLDPQVRKEKALRRIKIIYSSLLVLIAVGLVVYLVIAFIGFGK